MSRAIDDVVRFSSQPTPRAARDELSKIARECAGFNESMSFSALSAPPICGTDGSTITVAEFCARAIAHREIRTFGDSRSSPYSHPCRGLLHNRIGIAKKVKVLPSTPSRAPTGREAGTAFLNFVQAALAISRDVIKSSPLADEQKRAARSILRVQSRGALIKILETLRGRIGDYGYRRYGGLAGW